jgi:hypothetical protein
MPRSRGRFPKKTNQTQQTLIARLGKKQPTSHTRPLKRIVDHPIAAFLCLIAAIVALVLSANDALREPEIPDPENPDPSSPFAVPFTVKNKSFLFRMKNAQMVCEIDNVTLVQGGGLRGAKFIGNGATSIEPDGHASYRCPIGFAGRNMVGIQPNMIISAHIYLTIEYRTFLWPWLRAPRTEFTWFTTRPCLDGSGELS